MQMKFGWLVNLVLLVGVAALAGYAWHQSKQPKEPSHKLSTLSAAAAKRIEVAGKSGNAYTLEKDTDTWFLATPMRARADQSQAQRILDLLSATSKDKLPATDVARFDLDRPALTVKIDDQVFAFGMTNPLTQDQYLASGDGVYLVSAYYASLIPAQAERMLAHNLFQPQETPVGFTLNDFRVVQQDGKWTLQPPPAEGAEQLSADEINRWAEDWRFASSLVTQPWNGKPAARVVRVKLADGKVLDLSILQTEPEMILGRPDEKLQFRFSGEMSRRLLQRPGKEPG